MQLTNAAASPQRLSVADDCGLHSKKLGSEQHTALLLGNNTPDFNLFASGRMMLSRRVVELGSKAKCKEHKVKSRPYQATDTEDTQPTCPVLFETLHLLMPLARVPSSSVI